MPESAGEPPANRPSPTASLTRAEWGLILVLAAIQFTHMVDFVIIMPLAGRLVKELDITDEQFALIVAAYAWAAGIASLLGSFVMDRLDRRTVLLTMYAGFGLSTLFCGLADTYETLLLGRTLAGVCGGLAAVALMTVIADVIPPEKRGRATGVVMSAFAVASIAGLPAGLLLAEWFGRGAPFQALAGLSAAVWVLGWARLPRVRGHLGIARPGRWEEFTAVVREPAHLWAFAFSFTLSLGTFTVASFIGRYLTATNGWSEQQLAVIYLACGVCTLVGMNIVGRLADRYSRQSLFRVLALAAVVMAVVITNLPAGPLWVAALALSGFMVFAAGRMVPAQTLLMGTAAPEVRGAFMSLNTAVMHISTGVAPLIAGAIVYKTPDGKLGGFPLVGLVAAVSAAVSLVLAGRLRSTDGVKRPVPVEVERSAVVTPIHGDEVAVSAAP